MLLDLGGIRFRVGEEGAHSRGWPPEMPGRLRDVFSGAVCVHDLPNGDTMSENIGHTRGEADGGAAAGGIRLVMSRTLSFSSGNCGCVRSRKSMQSWATITATAGWRMGNVGSWRN